MTGIAKNPGSDASSCARWIVASLCLLTVVAATPGLPAPAPARVIVETNAGPFTVELRDDLARAAVGLFLSRAGLRATPQGVAELARYDGTQLCESRAHGFIIFGCAPFEKVGPRPQAPGRGPAQPDEIDGWALGLGERRITDPKEIHWLWQSEIFPRQSQLRAAGKPVPEGLQALVDTLQREGMAATAAIEGWTRLRYLETLGFQYTRGRSALRMMRGAVATANLWPGEADERFFIALTDIPERDGRATVFGQVVDGWATLEALEAAPVDKSHRPLDPVFIRRIIESRPPAASGGEKEANK